MVILQPYAKQGAGVSQQTWDGGMNLLVSQAILAPVPPHGMSILFHWFYCKVVFCI